MRHLHFDALGGVAGDMFVAAMADAFPALREEATGWAARLSGAECAVVPHGDGTLTGARFGVTVPPDTASHDHVHGQPHGHTTWAEIRHRLSGSALPEAANAHAIGIFAELAEAEARVHGRAVDEVTFHEVGATDSVADIVAAAVLIAGAAAGSHSVSSLPLGGGQIRTAHGIMPVPAPATARLLDGFAVHDDAIAGERVTPTGAAILRHLGCAGSTRPAGTLRQTGIGFGTRRLPGISNCLRVMVTEDAAASSGHRDLAVVSFEVDDQSGEDLAAGLDRVRDLAFVHDVVQMAAFGKKNRMAAHVQVLGRPDALDAIIEACFRETTTIGLRTHLVQGRALPRRMTEVAVGDRTVRVKWVERPGGPTGKAEAADLAALPDHAARQRIRREAELLPQREITS